MTDDDRFEPSDDPAVEEGADPLPEAPPEPGLEHEEHVAPAPPD